MRVEQCTFSVSHFDLLILLTNHLIFTDKQLSELTKSVNFCTSSQCFAHHLIMMINCFFDYHPAPLIYTWFSFLKKRGA